MEEVFFHLLKTKLYSYKKNKNSREEVEKKGLPATPYSTLPWPAKRREKFTVRKTYIWLYHISSCRHCEAFFSTSYLSLYATTG